VHIPAGTIFDEMNPPSESTPGPQYDSAIITTTGATLTAAKPCKVVAGKAVNQIIDITEGARLFAIPEDGDVLPASCLRLIEPPRATSLPP
jgi:hypothetical protein